MMWSLLSALLEISGTTITALPSTDPTVIAEVEIKNVASNTEKDNGVYPMAFEEIVFEVEFAYNDGEFGADRITINPPLGIICEPADCSALVLESFEGVILLKEYSGF